MAYSQIWEAARRLHAAGFSLIPCKYKKPRVESWQEYTIKRASLRQVDSWFADYEIGQSIGVVLGQVSFNVVAIDLDGMAAARLFKMRFPQLLETRIVLSGSRQGFHLFYRVENLTANLNVRIPDVGGIEIRGDGQYVIAPPSPHLSGHAYQLHKDAQIMRLDDLSEVANWLTALRETNQADRSEAIAEVAASKPVQIKVTAKKSAYLKKVMGQELARVTTSSNGSRNQSLFYAALRLANFAAGGELSWQDCEMQLMAAANSVGTPENEAKRTIASAWHIGSKNPKKVK